MRKPKEGYGRWPSGGDTGSAAPKKKHTPETAPGSAMSQVLDVVRNTASGFVFEAVHAFGRTTTEHRVSKRVHKVRWALEYRQSQIAPAQRQALAMVYGCAMPPGECAQRLGLTRQAFHERLTNGERRVDDLYDGKVPARPRQGRPNAKLNAPDGAQWMELRARESLGVGAAFIWGEDESPSSLPDEEYLRILDEEHAKDELRADLQAIQEQGLEP